MNSNKTAVEEEAVPLKKAGRSSKKVNAPEPEPQIPVKLPARQTKKFYDWPTTTGETCEPKLHHCSVVISLLIKKVSICEKQFFKYTPV